MKQKRGAENVDWNAYYPRPQLKRESFYSLNGMWQLDGSDITVPFPPQSRLSGYKGEIRDEMTYTRSFALPAAFLPDGYRLMLRFGAVDQIAEVLVNGKLLCRHEGGYSTFRVEITPYLQEENHLSVRVENEKNDGGNFSFIFVVFLGPCRRGNACSKCKISIVT